MLALSLSLDLVHSFPIQLAGQCNTWPSPARSAWQFTANPLNQAVDSHIDPHLILTQSTGLLNKAGSYYCWNRTYDPSTGSWTTPDPAASPWTNRFIYVGVDPTLISDPTGLDGNDEETVDPDTTSPDGVVEFKPWRKEACGKIRFELIQKYNNGDAVISRPERHFRQTGLHVKISYQPDKCCCSTIYPVQFAKLEYSDENGDWHNWVLGESTDFDKAWHHYDSQGWKVDSKDGTWSYGRERAGEVQYGKCGSPAKDAFLTDFPGANVGGKYKGYKFKYVTCFICDDGQLLGCIYWQFEIDRNNKVLFDETEDVWGSTLGRVGNFNKDSTRKAWNDNERPENQIPHAKRPKCDCD